MGGAFVAFFLLENFAVVDGIMTGLFNPGLGHTLLLITQKENR